jgi:hypothetical protein
MSDISEHGFVSIIDGFVGVLSRLDLASPLDAQTKSLLTRMHQDYPVLVVRGQSLGTEAEAAYSMDEYRLLMRAKISVAA